MKPNGPRVTTPAPDVACHNDNRIAKVDRASLPIREPAIVHDLQQRIPDVRMGLLDLVKENHLVGATSYLLRELTALVIANVAGRCAKEAADRMRLSILAHVDTQKGIVVIEHEARKRFGQLSLAHAGRSQKQEGADRPLADLSDHCGPDGSRR